MQSILDEIKPIFVEVLGEKARTITLETQAADVEGWDSFAHISIIVSIEEKFGVTFKTDDMGEMACVNDICVLLQKMLEEK